MADRLRETYKKSELARTRRDGIKKLNLTQLTQRLRRNCLSMRGLSYQLADRLIRFEHREFVPKFMVAWYSRHESYGNYHKATKPRATKEESSYQKELKKKDLKR